MGKTYKDMKDNKKAKKSKMLTNTRIKVYQSKHEWLMYKPTNNEKVS